MSTNNIDKQKTMTDVENTLYILQTLSTTESQDLEYAVIEVYYESDSVSKSGWRYDMPMIADAAIKTIIEQADKLAALDEKVILLEKVETIFNESPDLTFECVQRLFKDELAKRDLVTMSTGLQASINDWRKNTAGRLASRISYGILKQKGLEDPDKIPVTWIEDLIKSLRKQAGDL
jgi:hypothetical protein